MSEGPKVQILREDIAEASRRVAQKMVAEGEAQAERERREGPVKPITSYEVIVHYYERGVLAATVDALPLGIGQLRAKGRNEASALATLRLMYAKAIHGAKLVRSWDLAKDRAAEIDFYIVERYRAT